MNIRDLVEYKGKDRGIVRGWTHSSSFLYSQEPDLYYVQFGTDILLVKAKDLELIQKNFAPRFTLSDIPRSLYGALTYYSKASRESRKISRLLTSEYNQGITNSLEEQ